MTNRWRAVAACASILLAAPVVYAYVAPPERIHAAIAETNKASGRDQAIRLELTMQIGDRPSVATGELISHPTGLARLELRGSGGLLERHLLQGNELTVTRNGAPLDDPRLFLPPFFILQADTAVTLRAALESFDVLAEQVGLAECGDSDCLLIGDPNRAIPRQPLPELPGLEGYAEEEEEDAPGAAAIDAGADVIPDPVAGETLPVEAPEGGTWPRLWVETRTYEIRGFDSAAGARIRLGPAAAFEKLRVPAWITVEEPGRGTVRFDVVRASQVTAPAAAFGRDWLFAPDDRQPPPRPEAAAAQ